MVIGKSMSIICVLAVHYYHRKRLHLLAKQSKDEANINKNNHEDQLIEKKEDKNTTEMAECSE